MLENSHLAGELARLEKIDRSRYTPAQIAELDAALSSIRKKIERAASITSRKTRQQRADEDKRARVLGHLVQALAERDKRMKQALETLLDNLPEQDHYLFPERWLDAPRPEKPIVKATES